MTTLENIGNTCYLNSIIQILRHTQLFCEQLNKLCKSFENFNYKDVPDEEQVAAVKFVQELNILINHMKQKDVTDKQKASVKPERLLEALAKMKVDFNFLRQNDPHEAVKIVFDGIRQASETVLDKDHVTDSFKGEVCWTMKCGCCSSISSRSEMFKEIILNFDPKVDTDKEHILDLIEREKDDEEIADYYCDSCKENVSLIKSIAYTKLPPVLLLQINRFTVDAKFDPVKLMKKVTVATELPCLATNCQHGDPPSHSYELYGVVAHVGQTSTSGHYISFVKTDQEQSKTSRWLEMNDDVSSEMTESDINDLLDGSAMMDGATKTPYLIFYRVRESSRPHSPQHPTKSPLKRTITSRDLLTTPEKKIKESTVPTSDWNVEEEPLLRSD